MTFYLIGGLGTDKRVFEAMSFSAKTIFLDWLDPHANESLESYTKRFGNRINTNQPFGIIGLSFGGIVAVELNKIFDPSITILISSVSNSSQLPRMYVNLGKLGLLNLIPERFIKPPQVLMNFMFGAENKNLLKQIVNDTNPTFVRWALQRIIKWNSNYELENYMRIHGTSDRLIPLKGEATVIQGGGHFMIVDKADEISNVVNEIMSSN